MVAATIARDPLPYSVTTHLASRGDAHLCRLPCGKHKHDPASADTFAVGMFPTQAWTQVAAVGDVSGWTHYTREDDARLAFDSARAWLRTTGGDAPIAEAKASRKADRTARKVERALDSVKVSASDMALAFDRALMRTLNEVPA